MPQCFTGPGRTECDGMPSSTDNTVDFINGCCATGSTLATFCRWDGVCDRCKCGFNFI